MSSKKSSRDAGVFGKVLIILASVIAVAAVAGFFLLNGKYMFVGGKLYPVGDTVDMRGQEISAEQYESEAAKHPELELEWNVPVGDASFDCNAESIKTDKLNMEDVANFVYFKNLKTVDATGCEDYDAIRELIAAYPELNVIWNIQFGPDCFDSAAEEITLGSGATAAEITERVPYLTELKTVDLRGTNLSDEEAKALAQKFPEICFLRNVYFGGSVYDTASPLIDVTGVNVSVSELVEAAPSFETVEEIRFGSKKLSFDEVTALREAYGGAKVQCTLSVYGRDVDSYTTELDYSGRNLGSTADALSAGRCMPYLEKIIMCDCGISNEDMDALNTALGEDTRAIWTVYVKGIYPCRTDQQGFAISKINQAFGEMNDSMLEPLKYCTDLVCLDLGHTKLKANHTSLTDLHICENMTHLKYLIIGDSYVSSFAGLENCKELYYLEAFLLDVDWVDISAITQLTSLKHLNLCYDKFDFNLVKDMDWLERLWIKRTGVTDEQLAMLKEALPNTWIMVENGDESSVCYDWRHSDSYYEMRDWLGMPYMA